MMDTAERVECSELDPSGKELGHRRIVVNFAAVTGNVGGSEWNDSESCRQKHRNLACHLSPSFCHIISASAVSCPSESIALKTGICRPGHLEHTFVRITLFELLLHNLVPCQSIDIMDFVMHTEMVLHHQTLRRLFVAPCRLSHVGPESGSTVVQWLLLICSPPVGYLRNSEIHDSAVSTPWPWHVIAFACGDILHEITETVGFRPLGLVALRDYRILRQNHLEAH